MDFKILYEDENYIGIYKPNGIPVHRSSFQRTGPFLLQELRNQTGKKLYPVHRLDQAASGVMMFAFSPEAASGFCSLLKERMITKKYFIMVRGFVPESGIIESPLSDPSGRQKDAITYFKRIATKEIDISTGRYKTSRYSLVNVNIDTGRRHQIRRHFSRISHPVIGDSTHGDIRHNNRVSDLSGFRRLMLFSWLCFFKCPVTGKEVKAISKPDDDIMGFFSILGWDNALKEVVETCD